MHYEEEFIFREIPGRPLNYAPTLAEVAPGEILGAWYGGQHDGHEDVAIIMARRDQHGMWSETAVAVDEIARSLGNPVLHREPDGRLWLFYIAIYVDRWDTCRIHYRISEDGGESFGGRSTLREQFGWMARNKPVRTRRGEVVLPLYDVSLRASVFAISKDLRSWEFSQPLISSPGNAQPTVAELPNGRLLALMRTTGDTGHLWQATSDDGGRTWSEPRFSRLLNPNSPADMVRCRTGELVLVFNDCLEGRTPLTVAVSRDDGQTWAMRRPLEQGPGEFAYPAIIQTEVGLLHVCYACNRQRIKHVCFDLEWVEQAEEPEADVG